MNLNKDTKTGMMINVKFKILNVKLIIKNNKTNAGTQSNQE